MLLLPRLAPPAPSDIGPILDATPGVAGAWRDLDLIRVPDTVLPTEAGLPTDRFAAEKLVLEEFFSTLDGESGAIGVAISGI